MYSKPKEKRTTISISMSVKRKLAGFGNYGESMNDILERVLKLEKEKEVVVNDIHEDKIGRFMVE
jgi:hypothetical protein